MRKLLMATAAMLGASLGMANAAQVFTSQPGNTISTSSQNTNMVVPGAQAPSPATPAPGQIVVRLDLRENVYLTGSWGSADLVNGNKQQPVNIIGYPRFYTGFDGQATNGLKYGMFYEIRIVGASNFAAAAAATRVFRAAAAPARCSGVVTSVTLAPLRPAHCAWVRPTVRCPCS